MSPKRRNRVEESLRPSISEFITDNPDQHLGVQNRAVERLAALLEAVHIIVSSELGVALVPERCPVAWVSSFRILERHSRTAYWRDSILVHHAPVVLFYLRTVHAVANRTAVHQTVAFAIRALKSHWGQPLL